MNEYEIEWARGYGVRERGTSDKVDTETLFQACSISKPITAIAALRLVEQGRLDLDTDINAFLTSWKMPANGTWQPRVTPRRLLSHTAGVSIPGLRFRYSGGGYCVLQQLLMDVVKQPFPQLMREVVFNPLQMEHSTYEQPELSKKWENAASGHRASGKPVAGKWHIFPEMAAGGLWTTASDLARFGLSLARARAGMPNQLLSARMVDELLVPQSKGDDRP